tara:strand:+ start:859 stop:1113 length:255 start_codon:yes stop_codon:yes gene_type:complete
MFVNIDLFLVPIGVGTSLSPYIQEFKKIIEDDILIHQLGPNGTAIEGDWEDVFNFIKKCHKKIHQKAAPWIYTTIKVNTRIDKL